MSRETVAQKKGILKGFKQCSKSINVFCGTGTENTSWHSFDKVSIAKGLEKVEGGQGGIRLFDHGADPTQPPLGLHTHNDSPPPLPAGEIVSIELPSRDFPLQDYWTSGLILVACMGFVAFHSCHISAAGCICSIKCLVTWVLQDEFHCEITQGQSSHVELLSLLKGMSFFVFSAG